MGHSDPFLVISPNLILYYDQCADQASYAAEPRRPLGSIEKELFEWLKTNHKPQDIEFLRRWTRQMGLKMPRVRDSRARQKSENYT